MSFDPTSAERCRDKHRRHLIRDARPRLNGIDYVDVSDDGRTLHVYFLNKLSEQVAGGYRGGAIERRNVSIEGGIRIHGIEVVAVEACSSDDPSRDDCLKIVVDRIGDFSPYTLRLVDVDERGRPTGPLGGFDARYASVEFSFTAACPSDLDCRLANTCAIPADSPIEISYLAKDYATFRQLVLDRLALLLPEWRERHLPDLGIAIVELLAYVGDYLSYYQDAVATEAYLDTARRRVSVRRHARLVDYVSHDGCNARVWVALSLDGAATHSFAAGDAFFVAGLPAAVAPAGLLSVEALEGFAPDRYQVFEPMTLPGSEGVVRLYSAHNALTFYTWGDRECCLPAGATRATLRDPWRSSGPASPGEPDRPRLREGDVLIFEEIRGSRTGHPADADPTHRHAVRLTRVEYCEDQAVRRSDDAQQWQPVIEIEWSVEDALPFALCLSAVTGPDCTLVDVSIARGNVVLADHGRRVDDEDLGVVPGEASGQPCKCPGRPGEIVFEDGSFNPALAAAPLTFAVPLPTNAGGRLTSASALAPATLDPREALPSVHAWSIPAKPWEVRPLFSGRVFSAPGPFLEFVEWLKTSEDLAPAYLRSLVDPDTLRQLSGHPSRAPEQMQALRRELLELWTARGDLLDSDRSDAHFVAEVDDDSIARLRFGDGELGRRPRAGSAFLATYRIGNGISGNVGSGSIAHIVFRRTDLSGVAIVPCNPLAAGGGRPAEPTDDVRLLAPDAFRSQLERAVTEADYARLAARHPEVQRAAAEIRWSGNRALVVVAIDQRGQAQASDLVLDEIRRRLQRYRRIGHDLAVTSARYVPLDIAMIVEVESGFVAGHVKFALIDRFSSRTLSAGRRGFFHPDALSFGDSISVSRLVTAALETAGVRHVCVTRLQRLFEPAAQELALGVLAVRPLEIARLDSDRNFPEHGRLELDVRGGR